VRVFNLTDVPTAALGSRGLVNTNIQVGDVTIAPGKSEEVPRLSSDEDHLLRCGALSVGEPPPAYRSAKATKPQQVTPTSVTTQEETSPPPETGNENETVVPPPSDPPPKKERKKRE
jgi:hypothetical protein